MSLLDDVSIVVTPNGYKAGTLFGVIPVPTEGADVVVNGDFATDLSGWSGQAGRGTYAWDNGRAKITNDDASSYPNLSQSITTVVGKVYKITATVEIGTASTIEVRVYDGANLGSQQLTTDGEVEFYFTAVGTSTSLILYLWETGSTGHYCFFDNVSLKAINDKNHATTVFYGDELVENESFATSSDWTPQTGWTVSGNGVATVDSSAAGTTNVTSTDMAVVVGRTYYAEMVVDSASGTGLRFDLGGVSGGSYLTTTGLRTATITALTTAGFSMTASGSDTAAQISRVSVKEVGVASGWTDADQQLHIPQTALQSYNELAWFQDNGGASNPQATASHHNDFNPEDGDFTISAWVYQADSHSNNYFFAQGGGGASGWHARIVSGNGYPLFSIEDDDGSNNGSLVSITGSTAVPIGEFFHFVGVINRTTDYIHMYINGVEQGSEDISSINNPIEHSAGVLKFGSWDTGYTNGVMNGTATEFSIFKGVAFSEAEIIELYNDGKALDATTHSQIANLKGYWRNNGLSTWTNINNPGTHDATLVNATETILIPQGVDSTRDAQGFIMNKQKDTSCLNFPTRSGDYAEVLDHGDLDFGTGDFSYECWAQYGFINNSDIGGAASGLNVILSNGHASSSNTRGFNLLTNSSKFLARIGDGAKEDSLNIQNRDDDGDAVAYVVGDWYHIAVTRTGTTLRSYVDGAPSDYMTNMESDISVSTDTPFRISDDTVDSRDYKWPVDSVRLYSKELSAAEVLRNYNATKGNHRN